MPDQALIWVADTNLEVASCSSALRDFAGIGGADRAPNVGDLWSEDLGEILTLAHRWALEGETVSFQAAARGTILSFELTPLYGIEGAVSGISGGVTDLGSLAETQLQQRVYARAERQANIGIWHEDLRTGRVTISSGLASLLETDANAARLDIRAFDHPEDRLDIARVVNDPESAEAYTCDHRVCFGDGRVRAVRERVQTIFDPRGVATSRIGTLVDITDLKEREAELADLALCDPLTRLPNRALLDERLASAVARTARYGTLCAVLFIDLDGFKQVNDVFGHDVGDRLLKGVADRLLHHFRPTDTIARLGGDEFVVIVEDLYSEEAAISAAEKLLHNFDRTFDINGRAISISASIGVAMVPRCSQVPAELLNMADNEMYAVKSAGGRGVKVVAHTKTSGTGTEPRELNGTQTA